VLCKGTGSVDAVFELAGLKVIGVDWAFPWQDGRSHKPNTDLLLDICDYTAEELYFVVFIKTKPIDAKTRDSRLSSDSLIGSSDFWKTPGVTIHDNDTPRSLSNTLAGEPDNHG